MLLWCGVLYSDVLRHSMGCAVLCRTISFCAALFYAAPWYVLCAVPNNAALYCAVFAVCSGDITVDLDSNQYLLVIGSTVTKYVLKPKISSRISFGL